MCYGNVEKKKEVLVGDPKPSVSFVYGCWENKLNK